MVVGNGRGSKWQTKEWKGKGKQRGGGPGELCDERRGGVGVYELVLEEIERSSGSRKMLRGSSLRVQKALLRRERNIRESQRA